MYIKGEDEDPGDLKGSSNLMAAKALGLAIPPSLCRSPMS